MRIGNIIKKVLHDLVVHSNCHCCEFVELIECDLMLLVFMIFEYIIFFNFLHDMADAGQRPASHKKVNHTRQYSQRQKKTNRLSSQFKHLSQTLHQVNHILTKNNINTYFCYCYIKKI
jgi:hypothetical protein